MSCFLSKKEMLIAGDSASKAVCLFIDAVAIKCNNCAVYFVPLEQERSRGRVISQTNRCRSVIDVMDTGRKKEERETGRSREMIECED